MKSQSLEEVLQSEIKQPPELYISPLAWNRDLRNGLREDLCE